MCFSWRCEAYRKRSFGARGIKVCWVGIHEPSYSTRDFSGDGGFSHKINIDTWWVTNSGAQSCGCWEQPPARKKQRKPRGHRSKWKTEWESWGEGRQDFTVVGIWINRSSISSLETLPCFILILNCGSLSFNQSYRKLRVCAWLPCSTEMAWLVLESGWMLFKGNMAGTGPTCLLVLFGFFWRAGLGQNCQ